MIKRPVFKAHLHVELIPGEGVLILSEYFTKALRGDAYEKIIPLIDGRHEAGEIVDALESQVNAAEVYYALRVMENQGYLTEADPSIPAAVAAFWHAQGIEPATALDALRDKKVAVIAIGGLDVAPMEAALEAMKIQCGDQADANLCVVLTDDYLRPELVKFNEVALREKRPWLLVRPTGPEVWLGPLFRPDETACWQCLRLRLDRNRAVHRFVAEKKKLAGPPITALGSLPAAQAAACQMAAVAVAQFLAGNGNGLAGSMLSLHWGSQTSQNHALVRHPHCIACGTAENPVLKPIELQPSHATFMRDGGHRSVSPERTLKKYEHLVSPITGVVRILAPVKPDEDVAHVYFAGHNPAIKMEKLDSLKKGLRNASSGKGMSETQAKASALCEAIERYSAEMTGGEQRVTCPLKDWKDGEAIHPNDIMLFSERQYAERKMWNEKRSHFNWVPDPLDEATPIDWTPLWSLTEQRHKYFATQLVYFHAKAKQDDDTFYAMGCSNGNAAGNTIEEAILQGFFELVERDAVALWWYNQLRKPAVMVESFGEPHLQELMEYYTQRHRRAAWALDLSSDFGIPVFVAVSRLMEDKEERLMFGLGCHLDARVALQRAFAEMNQMLGFAQIA
ncbi:MAG TPA: TOMM precursor leader peptide-binding protein, partial [Verrucomicrobiaceae bacterium]